MQSTILDQEQNDLMLNENGQGTIERAQNQHQKPFMASMIHKNVPIGYQYHQIEVLDYSPPLPLSRQPPQPPKSRAVYLHSRINQQELEEYLSFVESHFEQKIPDYFAQGFPSRDRTRTRAMEFLHEMDYNYTKTKFYLLFPYYLAYNRVRLHQPLQLTNSQMSRKISQHLEGLKSTKEKQLERWIGTVETSIESRIHLNKLNTLIEVAKQNKYEIPEAIREHVQRSIKAGRQIKKTLHSTRLPLDKLIAKKESLQECKIITNEMIQFEETVVRCEQWLKKQKKFQETFFIFDPEPRLKELNEKIQFRTLQLLVNEFNNLPLIYDNFEKTTGILYNNTLNLLDHLPPLNKTAKTRTAQSTSIGSKVGIDVIRDYLKQMEKCPVEHEDFTNFENTIRENLQWLERIGLWLEDQRSEKSLKVLNQYAKIINDIPICNKVQNKLQSRLQYYEIMQRVKKDISNPTKYEQIKEAIKKLKEKGYQTFQYAKLQSRIVSYMGWYESQQMLNQQRLPNSKIQLLTLRRNIKAKMIPQQAFRLQLTSARLQLSIPEDVWVESEAKVHTVQSLRGHIREILSQEAPDLNQVIDLVKQGIKNGLLFEQFQILYSRLIDFYFVVAKMQFMLMAAQQNPPQGQQYFFNSQDLQYVFGIMNELIAFEVKSLQSKQAGDEVLRQVRVKGFPRNIPSFKMFQGFMQRADTWTIRAQQMINRFKQNNGSDVNIRQLIEQSKNCLHSKSVEEELSRIDIVLKWRQKIARKLSEHRQSPFDEKDHIFFQSLQRDLQQLEQSGDNNQRTKMKSLQYLTKWAYNIDIILDKISNVEIECTYKLSQMNKFCKEVDRQIEKYKLEDKIILNLKDQLQKQLILSDEWKEKYLAIKRFQRRKLKKQDEEQQDKKIEEINEEKSQIKQQQGFGFEGIQMIPYTPSLIHNCIEGKRKYYVRNGQFCWFFKLPLMVFQFYNGFNLKFAIEELVRLKTTLADIYRFICHYNSIISKADKTDTELLALELEGSKFTIFFRETYVLSKKISFMNSWKDLVNPIIKSVPVLSMELKARRPEQLLQLLQLKKNQKDDGREQGRGEQMSNKRKRKQNPFYSNEDMTLITQQTFGLKTKKKRKGLNTDTQYRNTAVASSAKKLARNQREELQRAEALLSGEVPAQLIHIDDPKEYCICRYGVPNENSVMVQCEYRCEEWFHIECLGIKKHQTKNQIKLKCVGCRTLYKQESIGHFFWDSHAKVTEYALQQLVEQGRGLGVETIQMKKLEILYTKMSQWKSGVKEMLKKICETNGQELPSLQPSLYELFLQSLWLPTAHPQAAILRKLVLMARNEL